MKMDDKSVKDGIYKITFMGLTGSGKTSIINRLINNSFSKNYLQTFEIRNYFYNYLIPNEFDFVESYRSDKTEIKLIIESKLLN